MWILGLKGLIGGRLMEVQHYCSFNYGHHGSERVFIQKFWAITLI